MTGVQTCALPIYGYSSFNVDITPYLDFAGKKNIIAVRAENKPLSARWYPGAGIYRNVRFVENTPLHIAKWGTYIVTSDINESNSKVLIETIINNPNSDEGAELITIITDTEGVEISRNEIIIKNEKINKVKQSFNISNPKLWDVESPSMYIAHSEIYLNGKLVDNYKTNFGIRSIKTDPEKGFLLNDKQLKIKGVCMHHDLGPLGAAINYRALERQLEILKDMGCNAIRTSHNMPAPELLELCDKMGFLVMDECFDEWKIAKNENGYSNYFDEWAEKDVVSMIHRDRNHPSVVMWSIGNEIREQSDPKGGEVAKFLYDIFKREDPTRPVTAGLNDHYNALKNGFLEALDIVGLNYKPFAYKDIHIKHPGHGVLGAETASTVSSRGVYHFPVREFKGVLHENNHCSSYDLEFPGWATTPDIEFTAQDNNDFVMGEFVWTGFDYLGEPTPYNDNSPSRSSYFGIVDLAGLKKDRFYIYKSKWSNEPVLHLLPHWNWEDKIGENIPVHCYTNYNRVELFVNGKTQGIRMKNPNIKYERYRITWNDVIYEPGELKAIAYDDNGNKIDEKIIKTAGAPYRIIAKPDRKIINADSKDLCFVEISIVDKDGNICPKSDALLSFKVTGNGSYVASCNGDPTSHTSFVATDMNAFNGKCVMICGYSNKKGKIKANITSSGLIGAEIEVVTQRSK